LLFSRSNKIPRQLSQRIYKAVAKAVTLVF
jgi:hypothetical protein